MNPRRRIAWLGAAVAGAIGMAAGETPLPASLKPFFEPPTELAGKFGPFASPLKFNDGRPVTSSADWPARRKEILGYWHTQMGPWPELLARPRVELSERQDRGGGLIQHRAEGHGAAV